MINREVMDRIRDSVLEIGEPRQLILPPCPRCGDNRVVMAKQIKKEEMETNPIFAEFIQQSSNIANGEGGQCAAASVTKSTYAYRRASKRGSYK